MYEYKCKCGIIEHYLRIHKPCQFCGQKLKDITPKVKTHLYENEELPLSKKFTPIYYGDQLWYYRRKSKTTLKRIKNFMLDKLEKKL